MKFSAVSETKTTIRSGKGASHVFRNALPGSGYHFRSPEEMHRLFQDIPESLSNTVRIAEMCRLDLPAAKPHMPKVNLPPGVTIDQYLREQCVEGLKRHGLAQEDKYQKRLDFELEVIGKTGFPGYFLVVADIVQHAKKNHTLVGPGRGSAASSLVSYALGITNLDPLKCGLLFERFLNPERINMPDIDLDFQDNRREEIFQYCQKQYGKDKVCQIITFGKLKPKAVFKDVARVFEIDFETANRFSTLIGDAKSLEQAYRENPDFYEAVQSNITFQEVYTQSLKLEGLTRQTGIHAAGVIVSDAPIQNHVPLACDEERNIFTQYEGKILEEHCGLMKIDILGLKTLTILDNTVKLIREHHGENIILDDLPLDDEETYRIFSEGNSMGIFQFESPGMQKYLKDLKPSTLNDLTAMNAMYRPGPLSFIPVYIAKKHKRPIQFNNDENKDSFQQLEKLSEKNETLRRILDSTNLIPIYQEQIMEIGQKIAGFTLGRADIMRRAMGKKKKEVLEQMEKEFLEGAKRLHGLEEEARFLFEKIIMPFAGYGFNKAHAVCYALVAYQTAYLKAHYPACFIAALLNAEIENTDKIKGYIDEASKLDVQVKAPSINRSQLKFLVEDRKLLYSLSAVKGVASSAGGEIIREREKNGPFASFVDFLRRTAGTKVNKQNIEQLIKSGCFDEMGVDVEKMLFAYPRLSQRIDEESAMKAGGQVGFFDAPEATDSDGRYEDILEQAKAIQVNPANLKLYEREGLGFNIKHDPLIVHRKKLSNSCSLDAAKKDLWPEGEKGCLAGVIESIREIITKKKSERMALANLQTPRGKIDLVFFPKTYQKLLASKEAKDSFCEEALVLVKGHVRNNRGRGVSFIVDDILPFREDNLPIEKSKNVHIHFKSPQLRKKDIEVLKTCLHTHYGGGCGVFFHFKSNPNQSIAVKAGDELSVRSTQGFRRDLTALPFVETCDFQMM